MRCYKCGSNVEEDKKFCTNCGSGLENDDAVMRIVEEVPIVNRNQGIRMQKSEPLMIKLKRNKKKVMAALTALAVLAVIFLAANLVKNINKKEYRYSGEFVLMTKAEDGKKDLYLGVPGKAETKLASDVNDMFQAFFYINTGANSRKYVYCGSDGNIYEVDGKGKSEQIAEGMREGNIMPSPDLRKYIFVTGDDRTLYLKRNGKKKVEIDKDIANCFFLNDNETILYSKMSRELFIWDKSGKPTKITDNGFMPFYQYSSNEGIVYMNEGIGLYYKRLKGGEEKMLGDAGADLNGGFESPIDGFNAKSSFVYRDKENLYYLKLGEKEPVKMAEGVMAHRNLGELVVYKDTKGKWNCVKPGTTKSYPMQDIKEPTLMQYLDGYLFYVDNASTLYRTKIGSDSAEEIQDYVTALYPTEKELYFTATKADNALYKVKVSGKASLVEEKTSGNVQVVDKSYIAYISEAQDLYVNGKKYIDVQRFAVSGKNICYVNTDNELFMIKDKSNPVKVCDNVKNYESFFYGGWILVNNEQLNGYVRNTIE